MKSLVLRFDIDTYRCIRQGVPNLLKLAREENVKFVFFCNMGRAISRREVLRKFLDGQRGTGTADDPAKLPASIKLGYLEILRTLLLNPPVGPSCIDSVRRIIEDGHDLGLHGGRNHSTWQNGFHDWAPDRVEDEVAAGKAMFEQVTGRPPTLFSSPGWQGSETLNSILKEMGFKASADRHGLAEEHVHCRNDFCTLPTNLLGEPGGVAYFESYAARSYNRQQLIDEFRATIEDNRRLYVLYDHPCYAGVRALDNVRALIRCAMDNDVRVTTYSKLIKEATDRDA